mmetsp:Transcript_42336/g.134516  ORF Transcript_42336/g.134516 Transcript_42336/m.134516 type:complete len:246 (-) Transcript_42336:114-851(-)
MSTPVPLERSPSSCRMASKRAPEPTPRSSTRTSALAPPSAASAASTRAPDEGRGLSCSSGASNGRPRNTTTPPDGWRRCSARAFSAARTLANLAGGECAMCPDLASPCCGKRGPLLKASAGSLSPTSATQVLGSTSACVLACLGNCGLRISLPRTPLNCTTMRPSSCMANTRATGVTACTPLSATSSSTRASRPKWPDGPSWTTRASSSMPPKSSKGSQNFLTSAAPKSPRAALGGTSRGAASKA